MTTRCVCDLAGHGRYVHIDARPPGDPWWAEWVELYQQMSEFFAIGRDLLENVAEWLRKVYISIRDALTSIAERFASVTKTTKTGPEPRPLSVPIIPDAPPCSFTLGPVKPDARSPP